MMPIASLRPIRTIVTQLGVLIELREAPKGIRLISEVVSSELRSEEINASLATNDVADWLTINDNVKLGSIAALHHRSLCQETRPLLAHPL